MTSTRSAADAALADLGRQIEGRIVTRDEPDYDGARRVWNGMIGRRPLAVVEAETVADVVPVVAFARQTGLPLAIRGGGHNVAGNGTVDDGIVLDLGRLKRVDVDEATNTVRVEPGVTLADVDRATEPAGLVVPIGVVSGTGMAGLTLGGGFGWLTRPFGLTIDSLLAAGVVTADGRTVVASADENPDLLWGLRGGGGNFGVVTSFTYRAYRLGPHVYAGNLIYRRQRWRDALRAYAGWSRDLPDALTSIISFLVPPPEWELGDDTLMIVGFTWADADEAAGAALVDHLRSAAAPDAEVVEPARWVDWQSQADGLFPRGSRAYWKNIGFDELSTATIEAIADHVGRLSAGSAADIHHMGGAFARVPEDATAFPDRSARYWLNIYGFWSEPAEDDARIAWTRSFHAAIEPHSRPGEYVNFLGNEGARANPRRLALQAYGPAKLERLVELKRRYDPTNLFRLNHNIPPD